MKSILIKDLPDEDHAVLTEAARARNQSLQRFMLEQAHRLAKVERNRTALDGLARLPRAGGLSGAELDELREASREQYTENIARKSGIAAP